jgi:ApeA N-terminal domain 1
MTGYKERFERIKHYEMLVPYNEISTNWGNIVDRWFATYKQFAAVLNLYFAVVFGKELFEEHKFLFLAQAIEGYHRCRFRTERTFRQRLSEVIEPVSNIVSQFIKDVPQFTKSVKDIRDELTHPGLGAAISHAETHLLWRQLKAIFEICFLRDLDVPGAALRRIAQQQPEQ